MSALQLAAVHGAGLAAEKVGVVAVALLAALVVLGRPPRMPQRLRDAATIAVLVLTPLLLSIDVWHTTQMRHLRAHPALAVGVGLAGLALVAALALALRRRPAALAVAAVAALPFRLPISVGGATSNLLIPLYVVVAAGALAGLGRAPALGMAPAARDGLLDGTAGSSPAWRRMRVFEWLLMGFVALYAVQAAYSSDFSRGLENVVFFYVPFALLYALLREVRWSRGLLLTCLGVAVGLAVAFAAVGFVEYGRKSLFLNPRVVQANQYDNYFRVNSLFFDPNIYGRFLALVMIALTAALLWTRRRREVLLGAAALAWLWGGLITSFSQSSIVALLVGLAVLAAFRWDALATVYVAVALAVIAAIAVVAAPPSLHLGVTGRGGSASNATSGRTKLISGGLRLFSERPLYGYGAGAFAYEYRVHERSSGQSAVSASHTIPVTVAAEQGAIGLLVYLALLVSAFALLFAGAGRSPPRIALAACFAALVVHTMAYADFLEDPMTWTLLGVGTALALSGARERAIAGDNLASPPKPSAAAPVATQR